MKSCLIAFILATALTAALGAESSPGIANSQIEQYYKDITYVATHSARREQMTMVAYMSGREKDDSFLKDNRLKSVYDALKAVMSVRLDMDGGVFKGPFASESADCSATATPSGIIQQSDDQIIIRIARKSADSFGSNRPVATFLNRLFHRYVSQEMNYEQIDTWLLVNNEWRIQSLHIYPI